jgi:tRNA pseudouridine13 synthase
VSDSAATPAPSPSQSAAPRPQRVLPPLDSHAQPSTYCSTNIPGTGGLIKARPEDFLVEELPAYEPAGSGEHIYLFIEKRNLTTSDVVRKLATHFNVRRDAIGFAGLKDRFAVTRQLFSVHTPGKKPADFPAMSFPGIVVHWTDLHQNKLRRGHLLGNRFVIRIREVDPGKVVHALKTLRLLNTQGAPNRVGEQRFGVLGRNHEIGRALLARDAQAAADALLGLPSDPERCPPSHRESRRLYHEGKFNEAIDAAPRSMHAERRGLAVLARGGTPAGVVRSLERFEQSFFVSAL